jgi:hypothetical protein
MSKPEIRPLIDIVSRIIDTRRTAERISPSWVAGEALTELDPPHDVERHHPLIWLGCHLELRQIARSILARRFDPEAAEPETDDLFPDLQWRYPEARSANQPEPTYVLRDLMSDADVGYNVARLRAEAAAKNRHADALEAWHRERK